MPVAIRLTTPAALLLGLLFAAAAAARDGSIDAPEAHAAASAGHLTLVDVRSPEEWVETGLPAGGVPVTIHDLDGWAGFLRNLLAAVNGDKNKRIALICASGVRSSIARRFLRDRGFENVVEVSEGMMGRGPAPGWIRRGLPTETYAP